MVGNLFSSTSIAGCLPMLLLALHAAAPAVDAPVYPLPTATGLGTLGGPFSVPAAALGDPATYSATGMPPGLTIVADSGLVEGTPSKAGSYSTVITASNEAGKATLTVAFTIDPAPHVIGPALITATVGVPFSLTLPFTTTASTSTIDSIPAGLSVASSQASLKISGTPTEAGSTIIDITLGNLAGDTSSTQLTITVNAAGSTAFPGSATVTGTVGTPLSYTPAATSGEAPIFALISPYIADYGAIIAFSGIGPVDPRLPPGVTDDGTGTISGTPTAAGTYPVMVTGFFADGSLSTLPLTFTIAPIMDNGGSGSGTTSGGSTGHPVAGSPGGSSAHGCGLGSGIALVGIALGLSAAGTRRTRRRLG
jgi:hypothetical protein